MSSVPDTLPPDMTVADLVARHPAAVDVFERLGIDYCCGGRRALRDVLAERSLKWATVAAEIEAARSTAQADAMQARSDGSLSALTDHIVRRYHEKLRQELPRLTAMGQKVIQAHGERHPEVREVAMVFAGLRAELESHMMKEEHVLFPFIELLESGAGATHPMLGRMASPIAVMEAEHDNAGAALAELRSITSAYASPADACATFRGYYEGLAALERELHEHIHLENNVLFPRAQGLEAQVLEAR